MILSIVLYECETWSLTSREEYLRTFCWEYLDLSEGSERNLKENRIMSSEAPTNCILHHTIL
jgi:hypothetical protein